MIVLNKRKKTWEMYPIGSPKGALNTKRKPEFIGVLKFKENDEDGSISINRFVIKDEKEDKLYPPSKAINLLRSQAVFLADKDEKLEAFLKQNNIKVRFTNICQHCSFEGEVKGSFSLGDMTRRYSGTSRECLKRQAVWMMFWKCSPQDSTHWHTQT